jgi:hypothetical protein
MSMQRRRQERLDQLDKSEFDGFNSLSQSAWSWLIRLKPIIVLFVETPRKFRVGIKH